MCYFHPISMSHCAFANGVIKAILTYLLYLFMLAHPVQCMLEKYVFTILFDHGWAGSAPE